MYGKVFCYFNDFFLLDKKRIVIMLPSRTCIHYYYSICRAPPEGERPEQHLLPGLQGAHTDRQPYPQEYQS